MFLERSGLPSLRDLPDYDRLEEAGLLGKAPLPEELRSAFGLTSEEEEVTDIEENDDFCVASVEDDATT